MTDACLQGNTTSLPRIRGTGGDEASQTVMWRTQVVVWNIPLRNVCLCALFNQKPQTCSFGCLCTSEWPELCNLGTNIWSHFQQPLRVHLRAAWRLQLPRYSTLTSPLWPPTPNHPIPDLLVLIKDVWVAALNPSYLSKTSFEKKDSLFGEGSVPGCVWG